MMLLTFFHFVLAGLAAGSVVTQPDNSVISPPVKKSDKKFFGKDYPWDKRPAVDVLHFKHPYPVVQDSDDFDRDFVKDENSDNGEYTAQTEYDRLRHKLAKEKAQVTKAMESQKKAETELKDALRREAVHRELEKQRLKRLQEKKEKEEEEKKHGLISSSNETKEEKKGEGRKYVVPESKTPTPGGVTQEGEVDVASGDTEKAMDNLEECKKHLGKAQDKLKHLTKELEEAKKEQEKTQAALDTESKRLKGLEDEATAAQKAAQKEYKEYVDAKEAYEKQQALVLQMGVDIGAAAAKVEAMRDAEDKDGGVYPTPRSGATQRSVAPLLSLALFALTVATLFQ